jgi:hypothetical protein
VSPQFSEASLRLVQPLTDRGRDLGFDGLQVALGAAAIATMRW